MLETDTTRSSKSSTERRARAVSSPSGPDLLSVGYVTKVHGLKGEVLVHFTSNRAERTRAGAVFSTKRGDLVIVRSSRHQDRWRVAFAGVADRTAAEAIKGLELFAPPIEDPEALWVHELIGSRVELVNGTPVSTVTAVQSNPASDLLVLADERLVPLVFVVRQEPGLVVIDPPAGLLDESEALDAR